MDQLSGGDRYGIPNKSSKGDPVVWALSYITWKLILISPGILGLLSICRTSFPEGCGIPVIFPYPQPVCRDQRNVRVSFRVRTRENILRKSFYVHQDRYGDRSQSFLLMYDRGFPGRPAGSSTVCTVHLHNCDVSCGELSRLGRTA